MAWIEEQSYANPWSFSSLRDELYSKASSVVIASPRVSPLSVAAYLCFRPIPPPSISRDIDHFYIVKLTTHPAFRRKGAAALLLDHLMQIAVTKGVKKVVLDVARDNMPAISLYKKYGFQWADGIGEVMSFSPVPTQVDRG